MEKRVIVDQFQKVTTDDVNDMSIFPESSLDHIVGDIGIPDQAFIGFPVVKSGPAEITVGNGRFYQAGLVYFNDTSGGQVIDLTANLPLVTRRVVAIVVWGSAVNSNVQPRTFLTDVVTRASVARAKATELWRWATLSAVNGQEGPDPAKPAVAANVCTVAWVTLDTSGIVSIEMDSANMVPSVREADTRLNEVDAWRATAGSIISTLRADLSSLSQRLFGLTPINMALQIAEDVARLKEKAGLPASYTAYDADHFLDESQSDTTNVDYLAKVEEGLRFADAAVEDDQLGLLNPLDPNVMVAGNFMVPAYDKVTRWTQIGKDAELNLLNYQYQTVTWRKLTRTRTRIRWGTSFIVSIAWFWWTQGRFIYPNVFLRASDGATFLVDNLGLGNGVGWINRLTQFWTDTWRETYWDKVTTTESVSGAMVAQTALNAQAGFFVELGLYFSRKAATGDVHVAICQTVAGSPDISQVIARSTINVADIKIGGERTPAVFEPTLLDPGARYGFAIITTGNHYLYMTNGNKFTEGSLFTSTDLAWFQGDLLHDIAHDAVFCQFRSPRVEVQLNPLQLAGGIVGIDINADTSLPGGTQIDFQVQQNGNWISLAEGTTLTGLPALLPFKAILTGSTSVMPGLGLLSNSRVRTTRPRSDVNHISKERTVPSSNTIHVDLRIDGWREGHHTNVCKILTGTSFATQTSPASTVVETPIEDANARIIHYIFTMSPNVTSYKIQISGTTDNVATPYVGSERVDVDLVV